MEHSQCRMEVESRKANLMVGQAVTPKIPELNSRFTFFGEVLSQGGHGGSQRRSDLRRDGFEGFGVRHFAGVKLEVDAGGARDDVKVNVRHDLRGALAVRLQQVAAIAGEALQEDRGGLHAPR